LRSFDRLKDVEPELLQKRTTFNHLSSQYYTIEAELMGKQLRLKQMKKGTTLSILTGSHSESLIPVPELKELDMENKERQLQDEIKTLQKVVKGEEVFFKGEMEKVDEGVRRFNALFVEDLKEDAERTARIKEKRILRARYH
jgi:hypothetical protein